MYIDVISWSNKLIKFKVYVEFVEDKDKIMIQGSPNEVLCAENLLVSSIQELVSSISPFAFNFSCPYEMALINPVNLDSKG